MMAAQAKIINNNSTSSQYNEKPEMVFRRHLSGTQTLNSQVPDLIDLLLSFETNSCNYQSSVEREHYKQQIKSIPETTSVFYSCLNKWKEETKFTSIFYSCLNKWKEETRFTSSLMEILMHPSYQRIIGLGPKVIPFILRELKDNGGQWFWALQSLTGENPVTSHDQGRTRKMAEAWLQWGREKKLI